MAEPVDKLERFFAPQMVPYLPGCPIPLIIQQLRKAVRQFSKETESLIMILPPIPVHHHQHEMELERERCGEIRRVLSVRLHRHLLEEKDWEFLPGGHDGCTDLLRLFPTAWNRLGGGFPCHGDHHGYETNHSMDHMHLKDEGVPMHTPHNHHVAGHSRVPHGDCHESVYLKVRAVMVSCRDCDDVPDDWLIRWQDGIMSLALFELLKDERKPWSNMNLSNWYHTQYRNDVNKARIEVRSRQYTGKTTGLEPG